VRESESEREREREREDALASNLFLNEDPKDDRSHMIKEQLKAN
jgi:hypothetical protein